MQAAISPAIERRVPETWRLVKRATDVGLGVVLLAVSAPIVALAALGIVFTTGGAPFFTQERVGMNGRRFRLFKLRTMVNGAHKMRDGLMHLNEVDGPVFKIRNDPRLHPLGRFLRRTSIDELPNLVNVVLGDISLVGPRPALPCEVEHYDAFAMRRLTVPAGLTCLWQINGRSKVSFEEWMVLDNDYVDTWTPLGDLVAHRSDRSRGVAEGRRALSSTCGSFRKPNVRAFAAFRLRDRRFLSWERPSHRRCSASCAKSSARSTTVRAGRWTRFWRPRRFPTILFGVFNGALVSALVPTFSEYIAHRREDEAWRLGSTVLNLLAIVLTACAVVGFFTARWYVPLIAHGFPAPQMGVAIRMTRWLMPSIVAVSLERRSFGDAQRVPPIPRHRHGRRRRQHRDDRGGAGVQSRT